MESTQDISDCKKLLDDLDNDSIINDDAKFLRLSWIFEHLPPQVAPRLQRDYDACLSRSPDILSRLFEKIDVSNKTLLNSLFKLFLSYGHLKLSLISYHIETARDEFILDPKHSPDINETECYDMTPLLPSPSEDSSLNWEHLMISSLIIDEKELFQTSFRLLIQKLHFHAILLSLNRYTHSTDIIKAGGGRVAEKICEKICDFAHDDFELVSIDSFLFNLLIPFTSAEQQASIVEAMLLARFKIQILEDQEIRSSRAMMKLENLISDYVMNNPELQEVLVAKLVEQLKCNIIRRKRRHSIESIDEEAKLTPESCLSSILTGSDAAGLIESSTDISIKAKRLQKTYLYQWVEFVTKIITRNNLGSKNASILLQTCSILLISVSPINDDDLQSHIATLLAKIVDSTSQRWSNQLFKSCGLKFLIELIKSISTRTELFEHFETPLRRFLSSYLGKYLRVNLILKNSQDFSKLITFVCDNNLGKSQSHVIDYIIVKELACFVDDISVKGCNKTLGQFLEHIKVLGNNLYKFIKRNLRSRDDLNNDYESSPKKLINENGSNGCSDDQARASAMDALVCILKIAIERKEQDTLDKYGELMLRLYNMKCKRIEELVQNQRKGVECSPTHIDAHLSRLMKLYIGNQSVIEPYLCYELNQRVANLMTRARDPNDAEGLNAKLMRKDDYSEIKTKLDVVQSRGSDSDLVYQTLINRQYKSVVDQTISQSDQIRKEKICHEGYMRHRQIILEVTHILFTNCNLSMYDETLNRTVEELEESDALDHPTVLYLSMMIESLIPNSSKGDSDVNSFKKTVPRISCCLIRISKLVELGPSIHSFTNAGRHKSAGAIQCCTYSNCIRIFTLIFRRFPTKLADHFITDAMQVCVNSNLTRYAKYSSRLHHLFIQLATAIASLLKSISIGRKQGDSLKSSMPIFLSVFTTLVRCIILASDRQKLSKLPHSQVNGNDDSMEVDGSHDEELNNGFKSPSKSDSRIYENNLELLAHDIGRLMNNLSFLEAKLVDYAPHVISTYVKDTQRASCPDFVKKHLDEGVFRIFNLIDAFQKERREEVVEAGIQRKTLAAKSSGSLFDMIHARLDQASREIFRNMHDNYNKFHRYQGKC